MRRRPVLFLGAILAVLVLLAAVGIIERASTRSALAVTADEDAPPDVTLVQGKRGPETRVLTLPGDVHAWYEAPLFGQVSGYVKMWYKDYGAEVRKGDLLAVIDTPSLDEQVSRAEAQLEVTRAQYDLAKVTAARWQKLSGTEAVSQQDVDVKVADARAEQAQVDAASSNLRRYQAQESFKRIVAPFDGVVTARHTDIGDYVNAGGGDAGVGGPRQELFSVSDVHRLRIFVSVPQDYSAYLDGKVTATLSLPQFPGRLFEATVLTTARAVDTESRTVLTELVHDNPDQKILPGAFVEVHFRLPTDPTMLIVPEQSLLFRASGMQVAVVRDGHVHLQSVRLGLNLGAEVQILAGLSPSDRIVANPSLGLLEGEAVHVVDAPPQNTNTVAKVAPTQPDSAQSPNASDE